MHVNLVSWNTCRLSEGGFAVRGREFRVEQHHCSGRSSGKSSVREEVRVEQHCSGRSSGKSSVREELWVEQQCSGRSSGEEFGGRSSGRSLGLRSSGGHTGQILELGLV